jgi:hypothetical protein
MTDRDFALRVLAERRDEAAMRFAQQNVRTRLARLQDVSPRVMAGAVRDAGSLDGYATLGDYELALEDFVDARLRHAPRRFDLAALTR